MIDTDGVRDLLNKYDEANMGVEQGKYPMYHAERRRKLRARIEALLTGLPDPAVESGEFA